MRRYLLVVAYDGTDFSGYQIQPDGVLTVEGCLNEALSELLGKEILTVGASRTDAGVHSYGNLAVFDAETSIPAEKLALALNTKLREDIRIMRSEEVPLSFHPRKCVLDKTYEYHIDTSPISLPTERRYSYSCRYPLDVNKMREAARLLEGEHDFTSFCSAKTEKENKVRTIYEMTIKEAEHRLIISVRGSGFLYNMVRILAGTLVKVGSGKLVPETIPTIFEKKDRAAAGMTLPPQGLFLKEIRYDKEEER